MQSGVQRCSSRKSNLTLPDNLPLTFAPFKAGISLVKPGGQSLKIYCMETDLCCVIDELIEDLWASVFN